MTALRACVILLALALPGCTSVAVTGGVGLGAGAAVRLSGIIHGGAMLYAGFDLGRLYGKQPPIFTGCATAGFLHAQGNESVKSSMQHYCLGLLPGLLSGGTHHHPWAFGLDVALGLCHLRLAWDPALAFGSEAEAMEIPGPGSEADGPREPEALERD